MKAKYFWHWCFQLQLIIPVARILGDCTCIDLDIVRGYLVERREWYSHSVIRVGPDRDPGRMRHASRVDLEEDGHAVHHLKALWQSFRYQYTLLLHCHQLHQSVIEVLDRDVCAIQQGCRVDLVYILSLLDSIILYLAVLARPSAKHACSVERVQQFDDGIITYLHFLGHFGGELEFFELGFRKVTGLVQSLACATL